MKKNLYSFFRDVRKTLLLIISLTAGFAANAQVASFYAFTQSLGTYNALAGGNIVAQATGTSGSAALDDVNYTAISLPFSFTYNGTAYSALTINSNGYITFGATLPPAGYPYSPISDNTAYSGAIAAFGRDIRGIYSTTANRTLGSDVLTNVANAGGIQIGQTISGTGISSGTTVTAVDTVNHTVNLSIGATSTGTAGTITVLSGTIKTELEGIAPNRTFVIQWTGFQEYGTSNTLINAQIRLNEGGGVADNQTIDIVYGTVYGSASSSTAQVGLRGVTNTDFNNRTTTTDWTATTAGTSSSATMTYSSAIRPPSGLTYTWSLVSCPAPLGVAASATTTTTTNISWNSPGAATSWEIEYAPTGTPLGLGIRMTTSSNPLALSSLIQNTGYTVYVRSICGPGDTSVWATGSFTTAPTCPAPTAPTATNITLTSADLDWTENGSATMWQIEYGPDNFTQGTGTLVTANSKPFPLTGLSSSLAYSYFVRAICGPGDSSNWSVRYNFSTLLGNNDAAGALLLTVNSGCTGNPYTNFGATQSAGEPFTSCKGTTGYKSVWFQFVAPSTGFVRISNDYAGAALGDTRMALFSASDPNDYSTFVILACDDDNGVISGTKSIIYANGLTPGFTYFVEVDGYSSSTTAGSFCITVDEVTSTMLAPAASCTPGQSLSGYRENYHGWLALTDNAANLIALVKNNGGTSATNTTSYDVSLNINSGSVRQSMGQYYLDRNYLINNSSVPGPVDVQFFFLTSELTALMAADATATLGNLNVTRQAGAICQADYNPVLGTNSLLPQTDNGSVNGVSWVEATSTSFSNFYIHTGINPLFIELTDVSAENAGSRNYLRWSTGSENGGAYFAIERSLDGRSFTEIGRVPAKGAATAYSFTDEHPATGINYYRLRMIHSNGYEAYSRTVSATVKTQQFVVDAYPNPAQDQVTIKVYGPRTGNAQVSILDITGKEVRAVEMTDSMLNIDLRAFAQGLYVLRYRDGQHEQIIRLNKQ